MCYFVGQRKTTVFCCTDSLLIIISASFGFCFLSFCVSRQEPGFFRPSSVTLLSCVPHILCSFPFWLTHTVVRCVNFQTSGFFQTSLCCSYLMSLEFGIIQGMFFRIHCDLWVEDIICPGECSMSTWKCWRNVL